jgi:hypothetical protein
LWHPTSPSNEWSAYRSASLLWVWMHLSPKFAIFFQDYSCLPELYNYYDYKIKLFLSCICFLIWKALFHFWDCCMFNLYQGIRNFSVVWVSNR